MKLVPLTLPDKSGGLESVTALTPGTPCSRSITCSYNEAVRVES